ncbi:hypothetical protein [Maridesulfovibrio salexigens]|uniref:PEP-CTERM protein-sorting domain-containing protein n=1 Tax=Maridesulfovibrio salexigens (strain ATCC 14822 / DSM 2638 / NCIMB 8403 / VKM B-1763) TaxID=526222 RepID=C6BY73_MARSD|nr:hypothetical protein [Maridesulfovibrio salexigens]ACS80603.1 hypothetical protein Desal_2547 [Maridesulfovibrio salexigens DSM 2638]
MYKFIFVPILAVMLATSAAQAATISGWTHPDYVKADINTSYSPADSSLLLTVKNTSPADSATLRGLLFTAPDVTLTLREVSYYSQSVSTPIQVTKNWNIDSAEGTNLNAEPMKYYDGLNTVLYTGNNFQGGNPKTGLDVGWTATFLFDVDGEMEAPLNQFIARFQSIDYAGMTASDSDFAHSVPTPIPGAVWLFTFGLAGIALLRQRIITS